MLLRSVIKKKSFFCKAFQIGTLHQVHSKNYGFMIGPADFQVSYKKTSENLTSVKLDSSNSVLLVEKKSMIHNSPFVTKFYLKIKDECKYNQIYIRD